MRALLLSLSSLILANRVSFRLRFLFENIFFKFCFDLHGYYGGDGRVHPILYHTAALSAACLLPG